jgi:cardiolipin synthase
MCRKAQHFLDLFLRHWGVATPLRLIADQAFSRAAGAPLVDGNTVELLRDAQENYPAWLEAINSAQRWVHFESYIVHDDQCGREFSQALRTAATRGVKVRLVYDWVGAITATTWMFWERLRRAGVEVRAFNQPRLDSPLGWMSRDHRKMLGVDGRVGFVTGLCVGDMWYGRERCKGADPWRDTGVAVRGPAVADIERAFADVWAATGKPLPEDEVPAPASIAPAGMIPLRVIATQPATAGIFRLDQLVAAMARERLWITDAYFIGASPYTQALTAAAADGVDVRLLLPGSGSDLPIVQKMTRAGYRQLLAAGVRIFEWNGTMLHAKTAVADGRWARVGSSNLNIQSWLGNWELDVAIEDEGFAREMEEMFLHDLENSTEVVANEHNLAAAAAPAGVVALSARARHFGWAPRRRTGRTRRAAAAGAIRIGRTFGAALTARRALGAVEAGSLVWGVILFAALGVVGLKWPKGLAYPFGVFFLWIAVSWAMQAIKLLRHRRRAVVRAKTADTQRESAA